MYTRMIYGTWYTIVKTLGDQPDPFRIQIRSWYATVTIPANLLVSRLEAGMQQSQLLRIF